MKKVIVSLLVLIPMLCGCTNIDTQITINNDKSASVASSLTYDGNLANLSDEVSATVVENYDKFLDPMFNVENAYSSNLSTITAVKSVKNLEKTDLDLSSLGFKSNLKSGKFIEIKKNFLITSYNIDLTYDYSKQAARIEKAKKKTANKIADKGLNPEYYQKYGDLTELETASDREDFISNLDEATKDFTEKTAKEEAAEQNNVSENNLKISFSIKTPAFASYNNADSVSGMVYSWTINRNKPVEIKLQYVRYSGCAISFMIFVFIALLVLLARKIVKHDAQKRPDTGNNVI